MAIADRFWDDVYLGSIPEHQPELGSCWLRKATRSDGYTQVTVSGRKILSHRWAYESLVGPIPEGLEIDHLCRVTSCVRPSHLEPVTKTVLCIIPSIIF